MSIKSPLSQQPLIGVMTPHLYDIKTEVQIDAWEIHLSVIETTPATNAVIRALTIVAIGTSTGGNGYLKSIKNYSTYNVIISRGDVYDEKDALLVALVKAVEVEDFAGVSPRLPHSGFINCHTIDDDVNNLQQLMLASIDWMSRQWVVSIGGSRDKGFHMCPCGDRKSYSRDMLSGVYEE
ncbi:hypothetical protein ACLOJK_013139 [Asimina triloba]